MSPGRRRRAAARRLAPLAVALLLGACGRAPDTPEAAFQRWQQAHAARDVETYFDQLNAPVRNEFLLTLVEAWRGGEWRGEPPEREQALGAVLKAHGVDGLEPGALRSEARLRLESLDSVPAVIAEVFDAVEGVGPAGIALWDLLPEPVAMGSVGAIDSYASVEAAATLVVFDPASRARASRTEPLRLFRDRDGRWYVAPAGL